MSILCSACATGGPNYGAVDLNKLHENHTKYGMVLSRSMYFHSNNAIEAFL